MAYKNPAIPKKRDVQGAPPAATAAPVAPSRGGGLMQRAATARVRQTKPGQPPIPTPAVRPPEPAPPKMAPMTDPGQRRDDLERERLRLGQQTERRRQAEEQRKKAEAMQPIDYRQQALQQMAVKGVGVEEEEDKYPTIPKPEDPETQLLGIQGEEPEESWAMKLAKQQKAKAEAAKQQGDDPDAMDPSKTDDEGVKEVEDIKSQEAELELEKAKSAGATPIYEDGVQVGWHYPDNSTTTMNGGVYGAGSYPTGYFAGEKGAPVEAAPSKEMDEVTAKEGDPTKPPGYVAGGEVDEKDKNWFYDEDGKKIGWQDSEGNYYTPGGNPVDAAEFEAGAKSMGWMSHEQYKARFPQKALVSDTVDNFSSWLNQQTGIPEQELKGQIAQVYMQSSDQIAKFANMMAARGVGAGGLMGAGMGQIASQAVAAVANIRFENEKMKIEEKLNKMKTMAALSGQFMSEQNRMDIFEQMNQLEQDKFKYTQEQDAIANSWTDLNDMVALLQAENGWSTVALSWVKEQIENKVPTSEIYSKLYVSKDTGKLHYWKGLEGTEAEDYPPELKQELESIKSEYD